MQTVETSAGVVPLRRAPAGLQVLLILQHNGVWCFPKGHCKPGETLRQAAARELREETGLRVWKWLGAAEPPPFVDTWQYWGPRGVRIEKSVTLFPAWTCGSLRLQATELAAATWCTLEEARTRLTFPSLHGALDCAVVAAELSTEGAGAAAHAGASAGGVVQAALALGAGAAAQQRPPQRPPRRASPSVSQTPRQQDAIAAFAVACERAVAAQQPIARAERAGILPCPQFKA